MRIALSIASQAGASGTHEVLALVPALDPLAQAMARALTKHSGEEPAAWFLRAEPMTQSQWEEAAPRIEEGIDPASDEIVEAAIARASSQADQGEWEQAREGYLAAHRLMSFENSPRRAAVLVCLAELERDQERIAEAVLLLDRALAIFPAHRGALAARLDLASRMADSVTSAFLLNRTVQFAESDDERVTGLRAVADHSLVAVCDALQRALLIRPRDPELLERLRAVNEAMGRYDQAVDAWVALSELEQDPGRRARTLVGAAELCARKTGNVPRAVALYEAAIADDPTVTGAFEAIEAVLLRDQDFLAAERAYVRQLERLTGRGALEAEVVLLDKLATLRNDELGNRRGAIQALDELVRRVPDRLDPRLRLASLLEAEGVDELALRCLEVAAAVAPSQASVYQAVQRIATRIGDQDRAYAASAVLVHMGEADLDQQMVYQQYAPETVLKASRAMDDAAWSLLMPEEFDADVDALMRALEPAAVALRLDQLQASRRLPALDPAQKQEPSKSTIAAVRTLAWAAQLVGLPVPEIFARAEDIPGGVAIVPAPNPVMFLGRATLTGRTIPELAFILVRELAYLRAAGRLTTFFPSLADLKALVRGAAVASAGPVSARSREASVVAALPSRLDASTVARVSDILQTLGRARPQLDLTAWIRSIERVACRAGFLASDDITVAARMLAVDGRSTPGLSAGDKVRDLAAWSVSQKYHALRSLTGLSIRNG